MDDERRALIVSIFMISPVTRDEFIHTAMLSAFVHIDLNDQRVAGQLAGAVLEHGGRIQGRDPAQYHIRHISVREVFASELAELLPMARLGATATTINVPDPVEYQ